MAYVSTITRYGREERGVRVQDMARDLAAALGGTYLEPAEPNGMDAVDAAAFAVGHIRIGLRAITYGAGMGRVTVYSSAHDIKLAYNDQPYKVSWPEATVSAERDAQALAKDIKRRVLDNAAEPYARWVEARDKRDGHKAEAEASAKAFQAAFPTAQVKALDVGGTFQLSDAPRLSGRLHGDNVTIDHMPSVSLEKFRAIAAILAS